MARFIKWLMRNLFIQISRLNEGIYFATVYSIFEKPRLLQDRHPEVSALKNRKLAELLDIPTDDPNGWERQKVYADAKVLESVEPFYKDIMLATSIYNTLRNQENSDCAQKLCLNAIRKIQDQAVSSRERVVCELLSDLACDDKDEFESDFMELHAAVIKNYEDREKMTALSSLRSELLNGGHKCEDDTVREVKQPLLLSS